MDDSILLFVKVTPKAKSNQIVGWKEDVLCVRIAAPPEKGEANEELERFLASALGIGRSHVRVIQGYTSRNKRLSVSGITLSKLNSAFPHAAC